MSRTEVDSLTECAGELKCDRLVIVTWGEERVIEKGGYRVEAVPLMKIGRMLRLIRLGSCTLHFGKVWYKLCRILRIFKFVT